MSIAAVTIISQNYLASARVLAKSYRAAHPGHTMYVALCDSDQLIDKGDQPFKLISLRELNIPDRAWFFLRYSIMEANTALKSLVLEHILTQLRHTQVIYLDPDIQVFAPLKAVVEALGTSSIVLTPHIRAPFCDAHHPTDLSILQSGTYNLGFTALNNDDESLNFLRWWNDKLRRDCIVDIARGLFVDQKWIDLVPGLFSRVSILRDPGYNVAYWNLHERGVDMSGCEPRVEGCPLAFFHFSGYSPLEPEHLSRHQNRFHLSNSPAVKRLCDDYRQHLLEEGYEHHATLPYAYSELPNGVVLSDVVRRAFRILESRGGLRPDPWLHSDESVRMLMVSDGNVGRNGWTPLQEAVLELRPDVAAAFPNVFRDPFDRGFWRWIEEGGRSELQLGPLLEKTPRPLLADFVAHTFQQLERAGRHDVFADFNQMWASDRVWEDYCCWVEANGASELDLTESHTAALRAARNEPLRVLGVYLSDRHLQAEFPDLYSSDTRPRFHLWLNQHTAALSISLAEISLFIVFCSRESDSIERLVSLYGCGSGQTIQDTADEEAPAHLRRLQVSRRRASMRRARGSSSASVINVGGHFLAPTGMGFSARSMLQTVKASGRAAQRFVLPTTCDDGPVLASGSLPYGWPSSTADVSITVASADQQNLVRSICPDVYWAPRNVAYWVWEVDRFPRHLSALHGRYDAVWAPSRYAATIIASEIGRPVQVLPHMLDTESLTRAQPARDRFGLPDGVTVFGFFFDVNSVIERKNPAGVVDAFRLAFGDRSDVLLIVKTGGCPPSLPTYLDFRRSLQGLSNVRLIEETLDRSTAMALMASLDVYVSLHRAEGFGLTCAEAMHLGKPVVATNYSGNLDFMDHDCAVLVPCTRVELEKDAGPYPRGATWAEPDIRTAASQIQVLTDAVMRARIGAAASHRIRAQLAPDAVAKRLDLLLLSLQSDGDGSALSGEAREAAETG